jgi:ParB-like chromosome segregation protein Spo0J
MSDDTTTAPFNWRDHLPVHPAADEFPPFSESELRVLAEDIRKNGLQQPIVVACIHLVDDSKEGMLPVTTGESKYLLLDGRNRLDALALLGWITDPLVRGKGERKSVYHELPLIVNHAETHNWDSGKGGDGSYYRRVNATERDDDDERELDELTLSLNVHRRHLTAEKKRDLIAKVLKRQPETSDRQIGEMVKADNKTVAAVRAEMEGREEIPHVETRTDSKGRKQPSKKSERQPTELEALRERAAKLGYKLRKRGDSYGLIPVDGEGGANWGPLDHTPYMLDIMEGKQASQMYTPCGMRIDGMNNSETWLAANPGATMEDFEKALPPAPTVCDLDDESPEPAEPTPFQPTDDADASAEKPQATTAPELQRQPESVVKETSKLHREVADFLCDFEPRLRSWSQLPLTNEAKDCMHDILMVAADQLMTWAQEIDGRGATDNAAERAANSALTWEDTGDEHHEAENGLGGGYLVVVDEFNTHIEYAVIYYDEDVDDLGPDTEDEYLATGLKTLEQAKTIAQQHYAAQLAEAA